MIPAFTLVLVLISLLLSHLLKAVRMPIANATLGVFAGLLEAIALNRDGVRAPHLRNCRATPMCRWRLSNQIVRLKETDSRGAGQVPRAEALWRGSSEQRCIWVLFIFRRRPPYSGKVHWSRMFLVRHAHT